MPRPPLCSTSNPRSLSIKVESTILQVARSLKATIKFWLLESKLTRLTNKSSVHTQYRTFKCRISKILSLKVASLAYFTRSFCINKKTKQIEALKTTNSIKITELTLKKITEKLQENNFNWNIKFNQSKFKRSNQNTFSRWLTWRNWRIAHRLLISTPVSQMLSLCFQTKNLLKKRMFQVLITLNPSLRLLESTLEAPIRQKDSSNLKKNQSKRWPRWRIELRNRRPSSCPLSSKSHTRVSLVAKFINQQWGKLKKLWKSLRKSKTKIEKQN